MRIRRSSLRFDAIAVWRRPKQTRSPVVASSNSRVASSLWYKWFVTERAGPKRGAAAKTRHRQIAHGWSCCLGSVIAGERIYESREPRNRIPKTASSRNQDHRTDQSSPGSSGSELSCPSSRSARPSSDRPGNLAGKRLRYTSRASVNMSVNNPATSGSSRDPSTKRIR